MNTDLLIIYIRNSRDIYALTEWLQNTLLKKVNRGLTPSVEYLANCSTMKKIVRMAAKNPYKPENERFTLKLTDEERTTITNRINDGYYRPEAVQARKDEEKRKAYEKKRAEIINDCKKKQQKAENEKRVMLAVLDAGLSVSNVIYYDHSNELVFNWKDYETKVTENDFNKFVSSVNRSLLPAGITFKMK